MAMSQSSPVVGVFTERGAADRALEQLQNAGFSNEQIRFEQQEATPGPFATPGGVTGGGLTGVPASAGGMASTPASADTLHEPKRPGGLIGGIKRLFAGRTDARIADDLVAMGVSQEEANYYQNEFELGRTIITVDAGDRRGDALAILRENGAYDITSVRATYSANPQVDTTIPNTNPETTDALATPETDDTQPRQPNTWDDQNA